MPADEGGNGRDLTAERAQLRRRLAELNAKDRLEVLLREPNAAELVRALPAEDLYAAVVDVGLADSTELVQLASPEQFRTFVDLGAWTKDRFEAHRAITWLRAARGDDLREFLGKVHELDLEVLQLLLRATARIVDREEQPDPDPSRVSLETPDGRYFIELHVEGAELSAVRALLTELIAEDPFEASRLLESTRWQLPSELEETAYRFRQARLADLGFPPLEQAAGVFTFAEPGPSAAPPAGSVPELSPSRVDHLAAALRSMASDEVEHQEEQFRSLANWVLVAEGVEPGDTRAAREIAEAVRDYLALGFEHLCGADSTRAVGVVRQLGLRRIFQIGFSLTLKLKFRADRLRRRPLFRLEGAFLVFPSEENVLSALRRHRPLRALAVEGPEPVPFRTLAELRSADDAVARAEQQHAFLMAFLGGTLPAAVEALKSFRSPLDELGIDRLFGAIVAHALLEGLLLMAPLEADRLPELLEKLTGGGSTVQPEALEKVLSVLEPRAPAEAWGELRRQAEQTLSSLAAEVGAAVRAGEPKALAHLPVRGIYGL